MNITPSQILSRLNNLRRQLSATEDRASVTLCGIECRVRRVRFPGGNTQLRVESDSFGRWVLWHSVRQLADYLGKRAGAHREVLIPDQLFRCN